MSEKQQKILEMAKDICRYQPCCNDVCNPISACDALKYAERAVEAGYSKQSEGEWFFEHEFYGRMLCSVCKGEALTNECSEYVDSDFCPNCGAKMKGGAK